MLLFMLFRKTNTILSIPTLAIHPSQTHRQYKDPAHSVLCTLSEIPIADLGPVFIYFINSLFFLMIIEKILDQN